MVPKIVLVTVAKTVFATGISICYISIMNTRDYKLLREGEYYHVYNRGINRETIFFDEQDYSNFLKRLKIVLGLIPVPNAGKRGALKIHPLPLNSFSVLAYSLMPNHFHILIRQNTSLTLSQLMKKVSTSYAKYFNLKYKRVGHVFQDIFKTKLVDSDGYLSYLSAYIHNNPTKPFENKFSSLGEYLNSSEENICDTKIVLGYFKNKSEQYKKFVKQFSRSDEGTAAIQDLLFDE